MPDEVKLALDMEVMDTFNISTDLDMANGADIELDREKRSLYARVNESHKGHCAGCAKTGRSSDGTPLTRTFVLATASGKRTLISRQQLAITPA